MEGCILATANLCPASSCRPGAVADDMAGEATSLALASFPRHTYLRLILCIYCHSFLDVFIRSFIYAYSVELFRSIYRVGCAHLYYQAAGTIWLTLVLPFLVALSDHDFADLSASTSGPHSKRYRLAAGNFCRASSCDSVLPWRRSSRYGRLSRSFFFSRRTSTLGP